MMSRIAMIYGIKPRRFCLIVAPQRLASWGLDKRLDLMRLGLAIQYIDRRNTESYRGYAPGELRCVGFDSAKRGHTIIEFEEAFALPPANIGECASFNALPAGRWVEIPGADAGTLKNYN
jgi:hypothetical protein